MLNALAADGEVSEGEGDVPGVLPLVERAGSDRLRGGAAAGHVPLPARHRQRIPQAHAAARLHLTPTQEGAGPRGRENHR